MCKNYFTDAEIVFTDAEIVFTDAEIVFNVGEITFFTHQHKSSLNPLLNIGNK